ncbi:MAG: outer membrane protein transport protein [Melioribacteraceae bacterium]|nr:outer membrane protein transport protein [Melioribacteraceae bacterium]
MIKKIIFISMVLLLNRTFGGGFQINEHGARAMGLAGAFTALANDPSALYFNGAGITQLKGMHLMFGTTLIKPNAGFRGPLPSIKEYKMVDQLFHPINFYLTYQTNDFLFLGFSVNNQYGLGTEWENNWPGRFLAVKTDLKTFYFTPTMAIKFYDNFSMSFSLVYAYGEVLINRNAEITPFTGEANVNLEGNGSAFGFNLGMLYKPTENLSLGLSVRSESTFLLNGTATSTGPNAILPLLPKGDISSKLTTPLNVTIGAAFKPYCGLTLSSDFQYVGWSSYDKLTVDFKDEKLTDLSADRNYQNTFIARLGAEYNLFYGFDLRAGIFFDKNPVKDEMVEPTLPDANRIGFNVGLGYKITENINVDVAYLFLRFNERTISNSQVSYTKGFAPFNGTYNSSANLFGINFSYNLN